MMALSLGLRRGASSGLVPDDVPATVVPAATRPRRPGWRDPRILVGLVIVAASIVVGVKVLAAADDTVAVWAARSDLVAGSPVDADQVTRVRVRFADQSQADRYLSADHALPSDRVLDRTVTAGELLPRAALGDGGEQLVEVPLSVDVDDFPATVHRGSEVDVWVTPQVAATADQLADATRVLDDVVVVQVPKVVDTLSPSGTRQVVVGVPRSRADDLGAALGRTAQGRVVVTKRG